MTLALLFALLAVAPVAARSTDDSDLSGGRPPREAGRKLEAEWLLRKKLLVFPLDAQPAPAAAPAPGTVSGGLLLADAKGALRPARLASATLLGPGDKPAGSAAVGEDGRWALALPEGLSGSLRVRFSLDNARWSFTHPDRGARYAWDSSSFELPAEGGLELGTLSPQAGSENAKVGLIHLTFLEALDALAKNGIGLDWWRKRLAVNWPDEADYFSSWGFSLHLTRPEAWDVVLHELGHAVMHLAMRAAGAGGQHKIDECYGAALAWSEGWATFFAGAVRLDSSDPDARFEFLVPRRAPIRLENVPEDVCKGETNEWRVAAALWDIYDAHPDGSDASGLPFARLWNAWAGKSMGSLTGWFGLLAPGLSPSELEHARGALRQNSIAPPGGGGPHIPATLSAPSFD